MRESDLRCFRKHQRIVGIDAEIPHRALELRMAEEDLHSPQVASPLELVIGHMKQDGHLGRNFLAGATGDAINVILAATGHNFRLLRAWLIRLLARLLSLLAISAPAPPLPPAQFAAR